jgi:hypothetical protein
VPDADVPRFVAEGWELLPALNGTHHGDHSVLMRRRHTGLKPRPAGRRATSNTSQARGR